MKNSTEKAEYYFHQGTNFKAYEYMGCTLEKTFDGYLYTFRVWAPNALSVGIVSDFSGWDVPLLMKRVTERGIFECKYESSESLDGSAYKFRIKSKNSEFDKGDPYARYSKGMSDGASIVFCESDFKWQDDNWLTHRKERFSSDNSSYLSFPINIYEMHLGSFIRHNDGSYYSYRELAEILPGYVKYLGYTHVEFLPIQEHPYDASWGYQVCGFYAPTSRFGNPDDFKLLIDSLHRAGVGVILDWVPAHFPKDLWGLYEFDGEPLYEYQGKDRQESNSWGTRFFDLGREEVQSFLISNALYFLSEFHIDGLRVDAVAAMIYLDYDREEGEWIPNISGTNENLEAIAFIKKLNKAIFNEFSDVLMIAEESTAFAKVTAPTYDDGLGFNLKWNMGWANDFYDYLMTDPIYRKHKHKALNFPIMYAFSENYCLPISHDEVVHGKLSLINKMFGSYEDKFKQIRLALMLQMTFPGKKLLFMGCEFGQFREWSFSDSLEWFMLDYPSHRLLREYVRALNEFYLKTKALWELDFKEDGFEWINADEKEKNTIVYKRYDKQKNSIIVAMNFSGATQEIFFPISNDKKLDILFETQKGNVYTELSEVNEKKDIKINLQAFSGAIFKESDVRIKFKL